MGTSSRIFLTLVLLFSINLCYSQYRGGANNVTYVRLLNTTCTVVNTNPFVGGANDGFSYVKLTNIVCSTYNTNPFLGGISSDSSNRRLNNVVCTVINSNPFVGGSDDGHANVMLINIVCPVINANPFAGGNDDGHGNLSLINIVCPVVNVNPFLGGDNDGHANLLLSNIVCPVINTNPFLGGINDGHASLSLTNIVCPVINTNPFYGGIGDGHSNLRLIDIVCPVVNTNLFTGGTSPGIPNALLTNINCYTLPIDMLPLIAVRKGDQVDLYWATASEINSDYFTLEKSKEGQNFISFGMMRGAGNSTELIQYSAVDEHPYDGLSFYRIKETDYDGMYYYSNIAKVNNTRAAVDLYPNPLTDEQKIILKCNEWSNTDLHVVVNNALGGIVYERTFNVVLGQNSFELDIPSLSNGLYFVHMNYIGEESEIVKLMVNK